MAILIYDFDDYRKYIQAKIGENQHVRGYQKLLADTAKCQPSYFSQALRYQVELTADHIARLGEYWQLQFDEVDYFLNLSYLARCGSDAYRAVVEKNLQNLKKKRTDLTSRLQFDNRGISDDPNKYYSSWYPAALHLLFSLPDVNTVEDASMRLNAPVSLIEECIQKLIDMQMIEIRNDKIIAIPRSVHLDKDSPYSYLHHFNWRIKARESLFPRKAEDMHHTGLHTLSRGDLQQFKNKLNDLLTEFNEKVSASPEETAAAVVIDIFSF